MRAQDGEAFKAAADRYDAIKKGRVHLVSPDNHMLDPGGENTDGKHDTGVFGVTYGQGENADVYISNALSMGDRLLVAEHESRHLAGGTHWTMDGNTAMAHGDWAAYNQLSPSLRRTAVVTSDVFFHRWGSKFGVHTPRPEQKR